MSSFACVTDDGVSLEAVGPFGALPSFGNGDSCEAGDTFGRFLGAADAAEPSEEIETWLGLALELAARSRFRFEFWYSCGV